MSDSALEINKGYPVGRGRRQRRKITNAVMLIIAGLFSALAVGMLIWIVGYVVYRGGQSVNQSI